MWCITSSRHHSCIMASFAPVRALRRAQHRGFNELAENIFPVLVGKLQDNASSRSWAIKSLELSGHSLGGAMAVLIGLHFEANPLQIGGATIVATAITTSGQPMVTDHADHSLPTPLGTRIVQSVSAKLLRIRNEMDPVPLTFESYSHIGEELFFSRDGAALTGVSHFSVSPPPLVFPLCSLSV